MTSLFRRAGAKIATFLRSLVDPPVAANAVQVYGKDDGTGVIQLFAETSDGAVYQLTPIASSSGTTGFELFGSGLDGDLHFDGTPVTLNATGATLSEVGGVYTLARDLYASSIILDVGRIINPNGFRIFCTGTFTLNGLVRSNGGNGGNGAAGVGGAAGAAAIAAAQIYQATNAGRVGANAGAAGAAGFACNVLGGATTVAAAGADGGTLQGGGGGSATTAGGTAAGATFTISNAPGFHSLPTAIQGRDLNNASRIGTGGSGGAGGASAGGGGGSGGGSGAAGGTICIFALFIVGTGEIQATGGNGGNGGGTIGGGGGGGAGGNVCTLTASEYPLSVAVTITGGVGGTGIGGGADGGDGGTGIHYKFSAPIT